ncbi:hypothetical protein M9194_04940 [Vibrio sp. S4M6]|uniref:hypothetical protein n=1 Tax=Vibrio sinus TaxID=2946865 RepID=UPI00202A97BC|nr:hypothetical protein [Vibrio sinus]MCL9780784.1 hypothetical protein [Vibrio sinus]
MTTYFNRINWINIIGMLLGAATLQAFLLQLFSGHFTPLGLEHYFQQLVSSNKAPTYWNHLLIVLSHYSALTVIALVVLMIGSVIGLFFSSSPIYPLLSALLYTGFWLSNLGSPGAWIFELLFPALFSLILTIARWDMRLSSAKRPTWLGLKTLPCRNTTLNSIVAVVLLFVFSYFNILSKNGGEHLVIVTILFSLLSAVLVYFSLAFDHKREEPEYSLLARINRNYLFLMACTIGLMLIYQVNADISLHWFTSEGYKNLVDTYQKTSNAPEIVKSFLALSASISSTLAPTQFVFESLAALCLFMGIFRAPMYWLTTGLLALLMVIEFGIPATWPPTPTSPVNWVWELMLPTLVLVICSVHATVEFMQTKSLRKRLLGEQLFSEMPIAAKGFISVILLGILAITTVQASHPAIAGTVMSKTLLFSVGLFALMLALDSFRAKPE